MNPIVSALKNKLSQATAKPTVVNNLANPNSAASKLQASFGKKNPADPNAKPKPFKSTLPSRQKTFGVPGAG